jgi:hypothetical protein
MPSTGKPTGAYREVGEPHRQPHGRVTGRGARRTRRSTSRAAPWTGPGEPPPRQPSDDSGEPVGCTSAARSPGGRGVAVSQGSIRITIRLNAAALPVIRSRMAALGAPTLSRYVRQLLALDLRYSQAAVVNPVGRPPAKSSTTAQAASADAAPTSCPPSPPPPPPAPLWTPQLPPEPEAPWGWCPACGTRLIRAGYHRRCNCCGKLYEV